MRTKNLCAMVAMMAVFPAAAANLFNYGGSPFSVPDGNPNGTWSSVMVSGEGQILTDVTVSLDLSGGYNGDLYAYLSFNGHLVPLLNRVGLSIGNPFGWNGAGLNLTLADAAALNVHAAGNGFLTGNFRPDGQNISPLSVPASFNANGGSITLDSTFAGQNPNGEWSLFIADVVSGGGGPLVNSWSLGITAVPEPAMLGPGLVALGFLMTARRGKR